jgi:hypothetical protein
MPWERQLLSHLLTLTPGFLPEEINLDLSTTGKRRIEGILFKWEVKKEIKSEVSKKVNPVRKVGLCPLSLEGADAFYL